ncbi:hypothetical protein DNTS_010311 [Danionella cerebrum]|uniref:Uncharacterized protein n=1 Tax=Danionella cerebrum TaxID=2873325 RepID=A0A553Q545_9TELE|nr:hypothetical protein DNTS_010311 [Danionella translucida]
MHLFMALSTKFTFLSESTELGTTPQKGVPEKHEVVRSNLQRHTQARAHRLIIASRSSRTCFCSVRISPPTRFG